MRKLILPAVKHELSSLLKAKPDLLEQSWETLTKTHLLIEIPVQTRDSAQTTFGWLNIIQAYNVINNANTRVWFDLDGLLDPSCHCVKLNTKIINT